MNKPSTPHPVATSAPLTPAELAMRLDAIFAAIASILEGLLRTLGITIEPLWPGLAWPPAAPEPLAIPPTSSPAAPCASRRRDLQPCLAGRASARRSLVKQQDQAGIHKEAERQGGILRSASLPLCEDVLLADIPNADLCASRAISLFRPAAQIALTRAKHYYIKIKYPKSEAPIAPRLTPPGAPPNWAASWAAYWAAIAAACGTRCAVRGFTSSAISRNEFCHAAGFST